MTNEELAVRIAAGEDDLSADLWGQVEKYVKRKAISFFLVYQERCEKLGIEVDDLCQEGYFAVKRAVEKFDPALEKQFIALLAYSLKTQFYRLAKMNSQGWAKNKVHDCISLDTPVSTADNVSLAETIMDEDSGLEKVEENAYWAVASPALNEALKALTDRQSQIIKALYYEGQTFEATAKRYGISRGAVEIYKKASLKKLRNNAKLRAACFC